MQHKTDIEAAIRAGRVSEIEDAFRTLVNWPGDDEIAGLAHADEAEALLWAVAERLVELDDERIMPGEISELIRDLARGERLADATYASGAEVVLADTGRFRPSFELTFAEA